MDKHTKGSWFASGRDIIAMPSQIKIAKVDGVSMHDAELGHPEMEANARLIAAAPDLLEAAKKAVDTLHVLGETIVVEEAVSALEKAIKSAQK